MPDAAAARPISAARQPEEDRRTGLAEFVAACGWRGVAPEPLAGDASFRRYYRLVRDGKSAVVMDAPPPQEDVGPFVAVAGMLRRLDLSAPEIFAADPECGFLLIEDFGDSTYTRLLANGGDERALYRLAIDTLIALQRRVAAGDPPGLPPYDEERLLGEAALLVDWYLPAVCGMPVPAELREEYFALWRQVLAEAASAPPTLVLRDYHIDNLMLLDGRAGIRRCGLLDFQDAVLGMPAYDLVSLVEDARRDIAPALRDAMTERYLAAFPAVEPAPFRRQAAILAAQRNCKIIGIFTRLWRRDGKPVYLTHIPRVWRLLEGDLAEPALRPIARWLDRHLPPPLRVVPAAGRAA
jgi:aminoglycoside/choline kinase family phosphotransferase